MKWKPSSVLRDALLAGECREADDRVVAEYMAGPGRGKDPAFLIQFVRHLRADIGPRGKIVSVEIRPNEVVVWSYIEGDPAPGVAAEPSVTAVPIRSAAADLTTLPAGLAAGAFGSVQSGAGVPSAGVSAGVSAELAAAEHSISALYGAPATASAGAEAGRIGAPLGRTAHLGETVGAAERYAAPTQQVGPPAGQTARQPEEVPACQSDRLIERRPFRSGPAGPGRPEGPPDGDMPIDRMTARHAPGPGRGHDPRH